ncbi:hypothetical protein L195_g040766, partial [Trifolium pratense]
MLCQNLMIQREVVEGDLQGTMREEERAPKILLRGIPHKRLAFAPPCRGRLQGDPARVELFPTTNVSSDALVMVLIARSLDMDFSQIPTSSQSVNQNCWMKDQTTHMELLILSSNSLDFTDYGEHVAISQLMWDFLTTSLSFDVLEILSGMLVFKPWFVVDSLLIASHSSFPYRIAIVIASAAC